ncbi:MAG: glycosyltransferase [Candidatus Dadabacteria bacterium]
MSAFAIIVPCYNEAARLNIAEFTLFARSHPDVEFIMVNDGSSDNTKSRLLELQQSSEQFRIVDMTINAGKGEAVRNGLLYAITHQYSIVGYLDADLSTTLQEFYELKTIAEQKNADYLLGSRIKKIDSKIERSTTRHLVGRSIATLIDSKFKLGVYDTQCGAKIFKAALIQQVIATPFFTKWFFDVEILLRIRQLSNNYRGLEVPLNEWKNVKDSKINILSFPLVLKEMRTLFKSYKSDSK